MPLLDTNDLSSRFRQLVEESDSVCIAVAWMTTSDEFELLRAAATAGKAVKVIVGLSGNATRPQALISLRQVAHIRVGQGQPRTFHPKFYLFRSPLRNVVWIGSANLTSGGFSLNQELVHEFDDDGTAVAWFEREWTRYEHGWAQKIDEYCNNWQPPEPPPPEPRQNLVPDLIEVRDPIDLLRPPPQTWGAYVEALKRCDDFWQLRGEHAVLRERRSYIETITTGRDLTRWASWRDLTKEECQILLGNSDRTGVWGLLGSMKNARLAVSSFQRSPEVREQIRLALLPSIEAQTEHDFLRAALLTISTISNIERFSSGVATRLLTLARPDRAISVNKGSVQGLSRLTGLSDNSQTLGDHERQYPSLLKWLYDQPWYRTPEPSDRTRSLWHMRAALVDSFVYKRVGR